MAGILLNDQQEQPQQDPGQIVIQFVSIGSSQFKFCANNVSPLQMIEVAAYLEIQGRTALVESIEQSKVMAARMQQPNFEDLLRR